MAELKNIRIAVSGVYDYAREEVAPMLHLPMPGQGAPDWVEDKGVYKVYRPATVLAAAKDKFKMLPLTHHHPNVAVNGQNFQKYVMGYTGESPWVDWIEGKDEVGIRSTMMIYDDEALDAYSRGEVQLSPGYLAEFAWQKGTSPDGQDYDVVMKEIKAVNHLALLPNGRGGSEAVVLDHKPTIFDEVMGQVKDDGWDESKHNRDDDGKFASKSGGLDLSGINKKDVKKLNDKELKTLAAAIYVKSNPKLGKDVAMHRFNLLIGAQSKPQLLKYINTHLDAAQHMTSDEGQKSIFDMVKDAGSASIFDLVKNTLTYDLWRKQRNLTI